MDFEFAILNWIESVFSCPFMDKAMVAVTTLGNGGFIWVATGIILLFTKKYRRLGIILLIALLAGLVTGNLFLKNVIARPRPCWITGIEPLIGTPADYSFPSGHTLSSTIGATVLTLGNRKFSCFAVPVAVMIAFSRMYLYVHFPTDILGGIILGIIIGFSVFKIAERKF